jgi:hypothetical protein
MIVPPWQLIRDRRGGMDVVHFSQRDHRHEVNHLLHDMLFMTETL